MVSVNVSLLNLTVIHLYVDFSQVNNINCWWLVNSGSDDSVVLLDTKRFHTTAACADFGFSLYDGNLV